MEITVLICIHSRDKLHDDLFDQALNSLTQQTYKEFKTLCVLDECWSNTALVVDKYKEILNISYLEKEKKQGLAYAKNFGIDRIDTKYVAFLDADDLYMPEKLEKQINYIESVDVDFLGTHCWNRHLGNNKLFNSCFKINEYNTHEEIKGHIFHGNCMTHGSMLIKKSALNELGGYQHVKGAEDWDLWQRAIKKGYKFNQLPERLYVWTAGTSVAR